MLNLDGNVDAGYLSDITLIGSTPYVTWMEDFKIYVKSFNGSNWDQLGGGLNNNILQSAVASNICNFNSSPYVTWTEAYFGDQRVYEKHYNTDWIQDGTILNNDPNRDAYPTGIEFCNSTPYVVFHEDTYVVGQVYYIQHVYIKHFNGSEWLQDGSSLNIDEDYDAYSSGIGFVDGTPYVVWDEASSTSRKVYCKYYIPPTPTYTPTITETATVTPTLTHSATYTDTPTETPSFTVTPTATASPTVTGTPSISPTSTISPTNTPTYTMTPTATPGLVVTDGEVLVYPNPAREKASFALQMESAGKIKVEVYNILGEAIAVIDKDGTAGTEIVEWQCADIAAGIYIVRVSVNGKEVKKIKIAKIK